MFVIHAPVVHGMPIQAQPVSSGGGAAVGLAVGAVLLVGAGIAGAAFFASSKSPPPPTRVATPKTVEVVRSPATPSKPKPNLGSSGRPLVHDVDGDGTKDVIVWMNGAFTALNGKTGAEIWSAPSKGERYQAFASIAGRHLVDVSGVSVAIIDLGKGALEGEVTLEDKAQMPCDRGPAFAGVLLADGDVAKIDLGSRKITIEKQGACNEAESDLARRPDLVARKYLPPDAVSASVDAVSCGGHNVSGTYNYVLPDACGPKGGPQMRSLGDFDPRLLISTRAFGFLVLGQKAKGMQVPVAARIDKNKVVWNNTLSNAPKTGESSLAPVALMDDHFAGLFRVDGKLHLFSASLETGIADFDVPVDEVSFIAGGTDAWVLMGRDFIDLADAKTGEQRRLVGSK